MAAVSNSVAFSTVSRLPCWVDAPPTNSVATGAQLATSASAAAASAMGAVQAAVTRLPAACEAIEHMAMAAAEIRRSFRFMESS